MEYLNYKGTWNDGVEEEKVLTIEELIDASKHVEKMRYLEELEEINRRRDEFLKEMFVLHMVLQGWKYHNPIIYGCF